MRPPLKPSLASGDRQPRRPVARPGARPRAAKTVAIDDWHLAAPRKRPRSTRIEAKDCGCQGGIHRYRRQSDGNYAHATGSTMRESPAILTSRPPRHTGFVYRRNDHRPPSRWALGARRSWPTTRFRQTALGRAAADRACPTLASSPRRQPHSSARCRPVRLIRNNPPFICLLVCLFLCLLLYLAHRP